MDTFSVVFYETLSGEKPAKVFLNELSDKQRAKTIRDLKITELYGNRLREPQSKHLEDGIYELRTNKAQIFLGYYIFLCRQTNCFNKWFCKKIYENAQRMLLN